MPTEKDQDIEESQPLTRSHGEAEDIFQDSPTSPYGPAPPSSASTTSFILDNLSNNSKTLTDKQAGSEFDPIGYQDPFESERAGHRVQASDRTARRMLWLAFCLAAVGWSIALVAMLKSGSHQPLSSRPHNPYATSTLGNGRKLTLEQVLTGRFAPHRHALSWAPGASGEDGMLLQRGGEDGRDYLVVEDVRHMEDKSLQVAQGSTLMKYGVFTVGGEQVYTTNAWPSADHKYVLVQSDYEKNYRYSSSARYWLYNVETQTGEPLDSEHPKRRIQLAQWSPKSDAIVFTGVENNLYLRKVSSTKTIPITTDGGGDVFYGVPDWVYEEEVLHTATATWWSRDGKYVAFLHTDETVVPTYPVQYFLSAPKGVGVISPDVKDYPTVRHIKYPKAGAPMSTVNILFYDVDRAEVFSVEIQNDLPSNDRIIADVVWGQGNQVLIREHNRDSDLLKMVLVNAQDRTSQTVREEDYLEGDGGWIEYMKTVHFVPGDASKGRPHDGYIDTVIDEGYIHMAYFSPMDVEKGKMLTTGQWQVVDAPDAVDLEKNVVYFRATKKSAIERQLYSVNLDGTDMKPVTDDSEPGYYAASFSSKSGFMLLSYEGPGIPWQRVLSLPASSHPINHSVEENKALRELAQQTELPLEVYGTIKSDGFDLNYVERRPPHFDPKKTYPVVFQVYNGPTFQAVDRTFAIDFQSYLASAMDYVVVTVDGRGTGLMGRAHQCSVRGNIGALEAHDQITAAKIWASKPYVDPDRLAIWGWSYGGFVTLKTLETDAGQTFKYGVAVAPVTDWRYYDSVYTERYMSTPDKNPSGYYNASISNATALAQNVRFLVMHGFSDDNVHIQNTLSLLDKLDQAGVTSYDMHVYPDSDHNIMFHNGHRIVYQKLSDWIVNAFNGQWVKTRHPTPSSRMDRGL